MHREYAVITGIGLVFICGLILFWNYGIASMADANDPQYWHLVLRRMFGLKYGGPETWIALFGLPLAVFLMLRNPKRGRGGRKSRERTASKRESRCPGKSGGRKLGPGGRKLGTRCAREKV